MEDEGRQLIPKYGDCWGVTDIFQQYGSGVKTERDHICIHQKQEDIEAVIHDFLTLSENELDEKYQKPYNKSDSRDWSIGKAKADIIEKHKDRGKDLYKDILYRPFDFRKTCYTGTSRGFIGTPGTKIGQHMIGGANYALLSKRSRVLKAETEYSHFGICDSVSDLNYIGDQTYCCPLYLYPPLNGEGVLLSATKKEENFQPDFRKWLDKKYGKKYTPEQVLGYIYGVLHSPVFRTRYQELLKIDFPRIPFVDAARQFEAVSALGWELVQAHLMKKVPDGLSVVLKGEGKNTVEKMGYVEGRHELHINKDQHFINIPPEAWNFTIGGYQVLEKYLKERKQAGRPLGLAELRHIPNVVRILAWTHQKMQDIDTIFDCS